jgi:hypothetical protein
MSAAVAAACATGSTDSPSVETGSLDAGGVTDGRVGSRADVVTDSPVEAPTFDASLALDAEGEIDAGADGEEDAARGVDARTEAAADTGTDADANADADANTEADANTGSDTGAATDAGSDTGAATDTGSDIGTDAGCGTGVVLINEIQTAGDAGAEDEWVELRNPLACPLDLTGYALKHASTNGTTIATIWTAPSATSLAPFGHGVVAGTAYSGSATPIGHFSTGVLAPSGGGLGLYDATGARIDAVGYGAGATNPFVLGTPAPAPPASESIARIPDGTSTGDNARDFAIATTPTPGEPN